MIQIRTALIGPVLKAALLTVVMSLFYFPIGFVGLPPSLNTKQILGVFGILFFILRGIKDKSVVLSRHVMGAGALALLFSIWCFLSVIVNNTSDYAYASYIVSFAVWLGGAYAVCELIKGVQGEVNLKEITKYLVFASLMQCAFVLLIRYIPALQAFVDSHIIQDTTAKEVERLYGIGCSLDSGGVRLCTVELLIAHQLASSGRVLKNKGLLVFYILSLLLICTIGCMVARTTVAGFGLALAYLLFSYGGINRGVVTKRQRRFVNVFVLVLATVVGVAIYFYNNDSWLHGQIRFAFEGFFSWVETGEFRTSSSDVLMERMWIWPWDAEGWAMGYGLFEWSSLSGFGIQTDIGYCRFILYCGLIGLALFSSYFIYNSYVVSVKFRDAKLFALLLLALTFIIWIKVATDIFQLYALLLCLAPEIAGGGDQYGEDQ